MSIAISPLSASFGAEVTFDPAAMTEGDRRELDAALAEYGVIVARGLGVSTTQLVQLTRGFGEPAIHPIESIRLHGVPEVIELSIDLTDRIAPDDPRGDEVIGEISWHSDLTYTAEPSRGSLLLAIEVPPEGGDTGFVDMAMVYAELPPATRRRIEGLKLVHSLGEISDEQLMAISWDRDLEVSSPTDFPAVVHPLVHRHPVSGERILNISPSFARAVVGWSKADSFELLAELQAFATQDSFTYFHRWTAGDLVIWDNWRTMHTATGHKKRYRRQMLRTTVRGVALSPA